MLLRIKKRTGKIIFTGILAVFFTGIYEVILRVRGLKPFIPAIHNVKYEPGFIFAPSAIYGYSLKPGRFKFILSDLDSLVFSPLHTNDSTRATRPHNLESNYIHQKEIYLFGASYTYGIGVEDSCTFSWLLQKEFKNYNLVNYGVPGYGPIHALIRLKHQIANRQIPAAVVLIYSWYHDNTNTLPRRSRETIARFSNIDNAGFIERSNVPFIELDNDSVFTVKYRKYSSFYTEWPLRRRSALVNLLETKYNELEESFHHSHQATKAIIKEINILCTQNKIKFIVAGITNHDQTKDMLNFCRDQNIHNTDISLDLNSGNNYRIHKKDSHPNASAHAIYASRLLSVIKNALPEER